MKLELVKEIEPDKIWYKVLKDGSTLKVFGSVLVPEEENLRMAKEYYDNLVKLNGEPVIEVIESTEI